MTPKQVQTTIDLIKYTRDCIFSPGGALIIATGLGFIPYTFWTVVICILVPLLDGVTKSILRAMQEALDETIKESIKESN